jgi:outer membrane immunogenic protein
MTKSLIIRAAAAALFAALATGPSLAADLPVARPVKAPIVAAPVLYNWSGFYVGGNVGAAWQHASFDSPLIGCNIAGCASGLPHIGFDPAIAAAGTGSNTKVGFTGGGQLGVNWQVNSVVFGVEADINGLSGKPGLAATAPVSAPNTGNFTLATTANADWLATVRGRIGFAANRWLIYATGGAAFAHIKFNQSFSDLCCTSSTPLTTLATSKWKTGYAVGGGVEYAFAGNWSLRGEYLYAGGFGSVGGSYVATSANTNGDLHTASAKLSVHQARAGLNYRFN